MEYTKSKHGERIGFFLLFFSQFRLQEVARPQTNRDFKNVIFVGCLDHY